MIETPGGETQKPETREESRVDVSKILAIIPPASELKPMKKGISEKRIRIRYDRNIAKPIAKIPSNIAQELSIKTGDPVEIVVAGKKKASFTAEVVESSEQVVVIYPGDLEKQGVADNSIATIRKKTK